VSEFRVVKRLQSDGAVIIEPDGDLDLGAARLLASVLVHSVGRAHPRPTVVEAHSLRRVDEAAVRFLAMAWPRDPLGQPRCRICRETPSIRRLFERNDAADLLADVVLDDSTDLGGDGIASPRGAKAW
jgi:hypothetical protein